MRRNDPNLEKRRAAVDDLLSKCADSKQTLGLLDKAIEFAEQACELSDGLLHPWPQLAAYRLAHLKMRDPTTDPSDLESLWSTASSQGKSPTTLSFLAALYRLTVLRRMQEVEKTEKKKKDLKNRIDKGWQRARDSYDRLIQTRPNATENEPPVQLQDGWFNLLELACYFLSREYDLEGRGGKPSRGGWMLVGRDPVTSSVIMSEELAKIELQSRSEANPNAVVFVLSAGNERKWRLGPSGAWKKPSAGVLKLLAVGLQNPESLGPDRQSETINRIITGNSKAPNIYFRKIKERTERGVREIVQDPSCKVFEDDVRLADSFTIFGAVESSAIDPRLSRRRHA